MRKYSKESSIYRGLGNIVPFFESPPQFILYKISVSQPRMEHLKFIVLDLHLVLRDML